MTTDEAFELLPFWSSFYKWKYNITLDLTDTGIYEYSENYDLQFEQKTQLKCMVEVFEFLFTLKESTKIFEYLSNK